MTHSTLHSARRVTLPAFLVTFLATVPATLLMSLNVQAETLRDCKVTGTVQRASTESDNVLVALRSIKPAESGAPCKMRRRERLQFKLPVSPELTNAKPGTRVEYRYMEDSEEGNSWKLEKVSR